MNLLMVLGSIILIKFYVLSWSLLGSESPANRVVDNELTKPDADSELKIVNIDELYMKFESKREGVVAKWYHKVSNIAYTGQVVRFYKNGYKMTQANLKNGFYCGLYVKWHSNGKKSCEINYTNGLLNGLAQWWYRSGFKKEQVSYENNKEVDGSRRYWFYKIDQPLGIVPYYFQIGDDA